jgi:hypothetical protein
VTSPAIPQSGLIVEVPEEEPAVQRHRARLDGSAALGVPAHITVLFPFMPPGMIDAAVRTRLSDLFGAISRFCFRLDRTDWFGGDVLWLAPDDPGPFRVLTSEVCRAFPAFPPYGGLVGDVVPHLTVGDRQPLPQLRAAEESVRACLPIEARATAVTLMTQLSAGGRWARAAAFGLA